MTHTHSKDQGQKVSLSSKVSVETDGQKDGGDCIISRANAVGNNPRLLFYSQIFKEHRTIQIQLISLLPVTGAVVSPSIIFSDGSLAPLFSITLTYPVAYSTKQQELAYL